jgi:transcriptional regulator with XRE-family HTH domain
MKFDIQTIKQFREALGFKQEDFALLFGVKREMLSMLETGKRNESEHASRIFVLIDALMAQAPDQAVTETSWKLDTVEKAKFERMIILNKRQLHKDRQKLAQFETDAYYISEMQRRLPILLEKTDELAKAAAIDEVACRIWVELAIRLQSEHKDKCTPLMQATLKIKIASAEAAIAEAEKILMENERP